MWDHKEPQEPAVAHPPSVAPAASTPSAVALGRLRMASCATVVVSVAPIEEAPHVAERALVATDIPPFQNSNKLSMFCHFYLLEV